MEVTEAILLLAAGMICGALNAIVGGAAFVAFPALVFLGIPPINANATMTVALWPGTLASLWAQRKELFTQTRFLKLFIPLSVIGGGIGAIIVIHISNEHFSNIVPYILCVAAVLFTWKSQIMHRANNFPVHVNNGSTFYWFIIAISELLIAIYIGFFGAGGGIMFMAFLGLIGMHNMHEANSVRNCSTACINCIATLIFIFSGKVVWAPMALMCVGAIVGGYMGAHYARCLPSEWIRNAVIVTAWAMTAYFFYK